MTVFLTPPRLCRRLFRKAEEQEAENVYAELRDALAREGDLLHASFCACAIAKCEEALSQPFGEASAYSQAGAMLLHVQLADEAHGLSGGEEVLEEAVHCFLLAQRVYLAQASCLAAHVTEQLAAGLAAAGRHPGAGRYYHRAGEIYLEHGAAAGCMRCWECGAGEYIASHDYEASAAVLEKLIKTVDTATASILEAGADPAVEEGLCMDHLLSLFLVQLIQRDRESSREALTRMAERLHGHREEGLVALLQGLVALGDGHDTAGLERILGEVRPYLTPQQEELELLEIVLEAVTDASFLPQEEEEDT